MFSINGDGVPVNFSSDKHNPASSGSLGTTKYTSQSLSNHSQAFKFQCTTAAMAQDSENAAHTGLSPAKNGYKESHFDECLPSARILSKTDYNDIHKIKYEFEPCEEFRNAGQRENGEMLSDGKNFVTNVGNVSNFIKVEITDMSPESDGPNWTDVDYSNPFLKDPNGFGKDKFNPKEWNIINPTESYSAALANIEETASKNVYTCEQCSTLFPHARRFLVHYKWHAYGLTNERRRLLADEKEQRRRAKRASEGDGDVACEVCRVVVPSKKRLKVHMDVVHRDHPKRCLICRDFFPVEAMTEHMRTHQVSQRDGKFLCEECSKCFTNMSSLMRHRELHMEKKFACDQCDKRFGSQSKLSQHAKTHERHLREPTHHCSYCGKGFLEAYGLVVHERVHRGERPYTCQICDTGFVTNATLRKHLLKSHSDKNPYECETCHRCFTTDKSLQRHVLGKHTTGTAKERRKKKTLE